MYEGWGGSEENDLQQIFVRAQKKLLCACFRILNDHILLAWV